MCKGEPPLTGTATVYVTVGDVNDNAPMFRESYAPVVPADATRGQTIMEFQASDADLPENGPPFDFSLECNDIECGDFDFVFEPGTESYFWL